MRIDAALLDKAGPSVDTERDLDAARRVARVL
jgi:CMP-2-keto-3-deoxyoctulosonic acid synthetase